MDMNNNQLQRNIMRRVYYAYTLRMVMHPIVVNGVLFGTALVIFAQMVHVARVVEAFQSLPLMSIPTYIINTLSHGELLTLASIATMAFALFRVGKYVSQILPFYHAKQLVTY